MLIFETTRLVVRTLSPDDAPFLLELVNEPEWLAQIGDPGVRDLEGARKYIHRASTAMIEAHGFGLHAMVTKESRETIGICGLVRRDSLPGPDLGFALLAGHQRKGYTFEAAVGTLEHARDTLGLSRLLAITSPTNRAAAGLLKKLGFRFEGPLDREEKEKPSDLYSIDLNTIDLTEPSES